MTTIKPSSHGIVVDHKESGVRYAVSDRNYNPKIHNKVRDLKPGESVLSFTPKRKDGLETQSSGAGSPTPAGDAAGDSATAGPTLAGTPTVTPGPTASTKTEGSSTEGTKESK